MSSAVSTILAQIKSLSAEQQMELARVLDRLTWAQRWRDICARIESRVRNGSDVSDEEIDAAVRDVRREKSLSERSSTRPS